MAKRRRPNRVAASDIQPLPVASERLLEDLRVLIREARGSVAQAVNSALVLLYWQVGHRILTDVLQYQRAAYGKEILSTQSKDWPSNSGTGSRCPTCRA
jgi:hypothetical protein